MCLAVPAQIIAISADGELATAMLEQVTVEISLALLDDAQIGDYVLIHVGYALQKIDADEAARTLALFAELEQHA